jgi:hypothetical protein
MPIRVDFRCEACGFVTEHHCPSPPPAYLPCTRCGDRARRVFSTFSVRRAPSSSSSRTVSAPTDHARLCAANPDIPGLCTLSPTAGRALVARARGDNRALEREIAYQEKMHKEQPGSLTVEAHGHHTKPSPTVNG